jgi:hypothetical protein
VGVGFLDTHYIQYIEWTSTADLQPKASHSQANLILETAQ